MADSAEQPFDLGVVGGGTAGHGVALAAAALGARCILIDPRERLGGGQAADLAEACLIDAAHARARMRAGAPAFDQVSHRRRVGSVLADAAANYAAQRLRSVGVTVIRGEGAFADERTVVTDGRRIQARRFVLATGAAPARPSWADALDPAALVHPATLGTAGALPADIVIVSETPAGLLWGQVLARLGASVTLLLTPGATSSLDPELLRPVLDALRRDGVTLRHGATVRGAEAASGGVRLRIGGGPSGDWDETALAATRVMHLGALAPALSALAPERGGVAVRDGAPVVNAALRTTNRRVFAIGDVLGLQPAGEGAIAQQVGLVLRAALFGQPVRYRPDHVPVVLRTEPALAQVGRLAPADADPRRRVLRFPLSETVAGLAGGPADGGLKVVASPGGRVLAAGAVGPGAPDAIVAWSLAVAQGVSIGTMAGLPVAGSPLAEASRRIGTAFLATRLGGPLLRRLLGVARLLP